MYICNKIHVNSIINFTIDHCVHGSLTALNPKVYMKRQPLITQPFKIYDKKNVFTLQCTEHISSINVQHKHRTDDIWLQVKWERTV